MATAEQKILSVPRIIQNGVESVRSQVNSAAPSAATHFVYLGGPLLANIALAAIFWGDEWNSNPNLVSLKNELSGFFADFVHGATIASLHEYSAGGFEIGPGTFLGSFVMAMGSKRPDTVSAETLGRQLPAWIDKLKLSVTENSFFLVFTPPGMKVTAGAFTSCHSLNGYHTQTDTKIPFGVIPFPCDIPGLDYFPIVASHEICEAITDPIDGKGWRDTNRASGDDEIADVCPGQSKKEGNHFVSKVFLNSTGSCK